MDSIQNTINGFLASLKTEATRQTYGKALKHFVSFMAEQDIEPDAPAHALTAGHGIRYVPWLQQRDYSANTFKLYLTVVYRFYRHLLKMGHDLRERDLARLEETYKDARQIRGQAERPIPYSQSAEAAVIQVAREVEAPPENEARTLARLRNIAVVECLRASGCRVGELVGLHLRDLGPTPRCALVKGKGGKYRHIYFDDVAWRALGAYVVARGVTASDENAPLFVGHTKRSDPNSPISVRAVQRMIERLRQSAGVQHVTPHYFRHVFATRALDKTDNLAVVQDLLGHASPVTTRLYAQTSSEQLQSAHREMWE